MSVTFRPAGARDPNAPACNVANGNVRPMCAAVGLDPGEYLTGEIDASEIPGVLAECEIAMSNCAEALDRRAPMLRDRVQRGRWIQHCSDDASACARLARLEAVLVYAEARGLGVAWS